MYVRKVQFITYDHCSILKCEKKLFGNIQIDIDFVNMDDAER